MSAFNIIIPFLSILVGFTLPFIISKSSLLGNRVSEMNYFKKLLKIVSMVFIFLGAALSILMWLNGDAFWSFFSFQGVLIGTVIYLHQIKALPIHESV